MVSAQAERFDVFLSYNRRDETAVKRVAERLTRAGLKPWFDRWTLTPGGAWQDEMGAGLDASAGCAVFVGEGDLGAWESQEIAVAVDRAAKDRSFRVVPVLLPGVEDPFDPNRLPHFLRTRTWVDFRRGRDDPRALQDLINALRGVPFGPDGTVSAEPGIAPYRGLRAFGEDDAALFFGRDRDTQRLLEKLKTSAFVAVLGPSGSGKSSLVRAGLVPALRHGGAPAVEDWRVRVFRPGASPLSALAAQIAALRPGESMQATVDALDRDPRTLGLAVELALADSSPGDRVLVVVDQLEEVFTLCRDDAQRRRLFSTLLYAAAPAAPRTVVVVTMRADFYPHCAAYPELAQMVTAHQILVGPMDDDGLRQAIEEPARRSGLELEDGLTETILEDVSGQPGALPLLEHALLELWERRRGTMLTLEGYRDAGGVQGALAKRADAIFGGLDPDQQDVARRTLLRLTQPGEGTEDTRRRAPRRELEPERGAERFDEVLQRLVEARMLTTGRDEAGEQFVDVSHEALIRGWPRLRGWIEADRTGMLILRRLTDAAEEWEQLHHEAGALYRGVRLAGAREWAAEHAEELSPLEREFLAASQAAHEQELKAARRRTRRLRALAGALGVLAALSGVLAVFALRAAKRADTERRTALSRSLAAQSRANAQLDPNLAGLLGVEAYRLDPTFEARDAVLAALPQLDRAAGTLPGLGGRGVSAYGFSGDGRMLAVAGDDGRVQLWDVSSRRRQGTPIRAARSLLTGVALSPDGGLLATAAQERVVRLWDTRSHRELPPIRSPTKIVYSAAFSPDGSLLATDGDDGIVRLWVVQSRRLRATFKGHRGAVFAIAFSHDGRTLASGGLDKTVALWDVARRHRIGGPWPADGPVRSVAISADGALVAAGGDGGTVRFWRTRTGQQAGPALAVHRDGVNSVSFSADGRTLATGAANASSPPHRLAGTMRLWDVATRKSIGAPYPGPRDDGGLVAFSPDGATLASAGDNGDIRLWQPSGESTLSAPFGTDAELVRSLSFSADGAKLSSAAIQQRGGAVRLWTMRGPAPTDRVLDRTTRTGVAAIRPDGTQVAIARQGSVHLLNSDSGREDAPPLAAPGVFPFALTYSPDGTLLAMAGENALRLWDVPHRRTVALAADRSDEIADVAFSPDGRELASADGDGKVRLWDVRLRRQTGAPLDGGADAVFAVAFSPDGAVLASADEQGSAETIRLWNVRTRRQFGAPLEGYGARVHDLAFSADGATLASIDENGKLRLWDPRRRRLLGQEIDAHSYGSSVTFSADGKEMITGGAEPALRRWDPALWSLSEPTLRAWVCRAVGHSLRPAEWREYVPGEPYRATCGP